MLKPMLAGLAVSALTACAVSTRTLPPFPVRIPPPPAAARPPCVPTPIPRQPDGSASSADTEAALRDAWAEILRCDDKRRLAIDAWPQTNLPEETKNVD